MYKWVVWWHQLWSVDKWKVLVPINFQKTCWTHEKLFLILSNGIKIFWRGLQLYVSPERKSGWRFTARFTYRCKVVLIRSRPRAYLYFCLPCDPAGRIISSYNYKTYRSESKFICLDELCANISLGALTNERFWCRSNLKKHVNN